MQNGSRGCTRHGFAYVHQLSPWARHLCSACSAWALSYDPLQAGYKVRFAVCVVNLIHRRRTGIAAIAGQTGQAAGGCLSEPEELSTSQGRARAGPMGSPCSLSSAPISAQSWSHKTCTCSCHLRSSKSKEQMTQIFFFLIKKRERKKRFFPYSGSPPYGYGQTET